MTKEIDINAAAIAEAAKVFSGSAPVFMVNLLRYKEYANYNNAAGSSPCSGREVYFQRYVRAFNKIASAEGVKVLYVGHVGCSLVAPDSESWDDVAIVEYPDFSSFRRIIESEEYITEIEPHRKAALADWRLIATHKAAFITG